VNPKIKGEDQKKNMEKAEGSSEERFLEYRGNKWREIEE
jgi:hypothetical protein